MLSSLLVSLATAAEQHASLAILVTSIAASTVVWMLLSGNSSFSFSSNKNGGGVFLDRERKSATLVGKESLSHDVCRFRFALPNPRMVFGLPIGKHFKIWAPNAEGVKPGEWNGRADAEADHDEVHRTYSPTSSNADVGHFEMVLKIYKGGVVDRFPDGGKVSQYLDSLPIGAKLDVAGPYGLVEYAGKGKFLIRRKERKVRRVGMIAGGTGLTPLLQIIKTALADPDDDIELSLLFANQTEEDIFLRSELEVLAQAHPNQFKIWYTLDRPPKDGSWKFSSGFINEDMLKEHMPPPSTDDDSTLILMCGPPPMIKFACRPNLDKLGYPKRDQVTF